MLDQAVQNATQADYKALALAVQNLQQTTVFMNIIVAVVLTVMGYIIKSMWEDQKKTVEGLSLTSQEHSKKFAHLEGQGHIADSLEKGLEAVAEAIENKQYIVKRER